MPQTISDDRQSVVHTDGVARRIILDKASNFRDLGGFKTEHGTTRFGSLYRSDQLGLLTSGDVSLLVDELGISQVVDLRGTDELEVAGEGPLADHPKVAYFNIPVSSKALVSLKAAANPKNRGMPVSHRYFRRLYNDAKNFKLILNHLIENPTPTVFNCVAGRDRTGLTAMLVLGAAGVSYDDIADDYAATVRVPEEEWGRSQDPKLQEFWKDYVLAVGTTHLESPEDMKSAMLDLLGLLDEDFKSSEKTGVCGYLDFLGVPAEKLKTLLI